MTQNISNKKQNSLYNALPMIVILFAATAIGNLFRFIGFPETNIVIVYLLAVLMTSWMTYGYIFGIMASVVATFLFNYFFTEPYLTFTVDDPGYIITFIIMTITAFITSTLTSHVKQSALSAQEKEAETKAVYNLTNHLTDARDIHNIASIAVSAISDCFSCQAACLPFDENGMSEQCFIQQVTENKLIRRNVGDPEEIKHQIEGLRTAFDISAEFYDWPIYGREGILGIIRIPKEDALRMNESQTRLLRSMIESTALAMDRFRSVEQSIKARDEAVQERYRGNLLRAISHDLRTPLSGIKGASEMIMDMARHEDPSYSLAKGIHEDADWLHSLVENILSLTRLEDGRLVLNKQLEAVEEVIGSAVDHIAKQSPKHEIAVSVPDELLLVPMDAKLIEQVLVNILDNATKHTPPENEISIMVTRDACNKSAIFTVEDSGSGIGSIDLPHIFDMFYTSRAKRADVGHGIGLGLAICDAIIKAHGGSINASNRTNGQGAQFIFTLPLKEDNDNEEL